MGLSPSDWHLRYLQQALWTRDLRRYLLGRAGIAQANRALEVGCGTGAILSEIPDTRSANSLEIHGLDINQENLELARAHAPTSNLIQGDAHFLPYETASIDLTFCHFLLLWVRDPIQTIAEMKRVTRSGGAVIALAEPDYGGRIDYPAELSQLGDWQRQSLIQQGADPLIGRRLAAIFHSANLVDVETGVLGGQWRQGLSKEGFENEWRVLLDDLAEVAPKAKIGELRKMDEIAWLRGERILYVPTFYAWARRL